MPVYLSEIHLGCLDMADEILLLTINELSTLRLSKLYLETLDTIKLKDKVKLVLNRQVKGQGLEVKKIEEILGLKVYYSLPDHVKVASSSIKTGEPFMISNSRSQLGKSVWKLSEMLNEQLKDETMEKKKEKRRFLIGK
jgi:pilus assembly protein CpaE